MKTIILISATVLLLTGVYLTPSKAQTPVTDIGAGIQREALWSQENGHLI